MANQLNPTTDTGLLFAVKREPARHVLQNVLSGVSGQSNPFSTPPIGYGLRFELGFNVVLKFAVVPGQNYTIDLMPNGDITAYFLADVYGQYVQFQFDINSVWPAGSVQFICLIDTPFGCALGFPVVMPPIPPVTFTIDCRPFEVPLTSVNATFAMKDLASAEQLDDDHYQLRGRLALLSIGLFTNEPEFVKMLVDQLFQVVDDALHAIPVLGDVLQYIVGFVQAIVDAILNVAGFVQSWFNFLFAEVFQLVSSVIRDHIWDPTVSVKLGRVPARRKLADEVDSGSAKQDTLYLDFKSIAIDVNTSCASPELVISAIAG